MQVTDLNCTSRSFQLIAVPSKLPEICAEQYGICILDVLPEMFCLQGRTGQASFFTNFLQFAGSVARVFTSIKEGAGMPMVRGFILGSVVNGTLTGQIMYYGKDGRKQPEAGETEEEKKER
jgi:mannose-P-dolichol utilization defect 1